MVSAVLVHALFMHASTKNPSVDIAHAHNIWYDIQVWYTDLTCTIYRSKKTSEKWARVKIRLSNNATIK